MTAEASSLDSVLREAMIAHRAGRLAAAEVGYRRVLRERPDDVKALHFLGLLLFHQGDQETAIAYLVRALKHEPSNARMWNALGGMYIAADLGAQAKQAYTRATEADASSSEGWYNLAICLRNEGENDAAVARLRECLAQDPKYVRAYEALAMLLYQLGRTQEALTLYTQWIACDPTSATARHMAAAASGENVPGRASDEYVRDLFDQAAEKFDTKLEQLAYRAPALVSEALARHAKAPLGDVLDAGCGTGLCGPLLREHCRNLSGVDLSLKMVERARERKCYDELEAAELTAFMHSRPGAFDAVISADTLVYFGALEEPLRAAHEALRDSGWLVFTVEALVPRESPGANEIPSHRLEFHGRYTHSERYVRSALAAAGFALESLSEETLRQEMDRGVPGYLVVARRN